MTHLRIEQTEGSTEYVSSAVIAKLYELATSGSLDNTSNLLGTLHAPATYNEYITTLTTAYPNLHITATNIYVKFEDPIAEKAIADAIGDGVGTTMTLILAYNLIIPRLWFSGKNITKLNELALFTNARWINDYVFQNSTYLLEISFPSNAATTSTGNTICEGCTNLTKVGLTPYITTIGARAFSGCTRLTTIDTQYAQVFGLKCFLSCSSLSNIDLSSCTVLNEYAINGTAISGAVVLPATCTLVYNEALAYNSGITSIEIMAPSITFGYSCFCGNSNLLKVILRCTSVPTLNNTKTFESSYPIYVVDSLLNDYKLANNWSSILSRLHGISELPSLG